MYTVTVPTVDHYASYFLTFAEPHLAVSVRSRSFENQSPPSHLSTDATSKLSGALETMWTSRRRLAQVPTSELPILN